MVAVTLSILFGLSWGIGLFATEKIYTSKTVRDIVASVFVILTAFHGLFLFIMHCLRSEDVRNSWKNAFFHVKGRKFRHFSSSTFNREKEKSFAFQSQQLKNSFTEEKNFSSDSIGCQSDYLKKKAEVKEVKKVEGHSAIQDTCFTV